MLHLGTVMDPHFVGMLEQKVEKVTLKRVDADSVANLIEKDEPKPEAILSDDEQKALQTRYETAIADKQMTVRVESLSPTDDPVTITRPEFMRRMAEMAKMGGGGMQFFGQMPETFTVTVNANHPLAQRVLKADSEEMGEKLARQAFDLALLQQGLLKGDRLTEFVQRSVSLLG